MQEMLAKILAMDENARKIKQKAEQDKLDSEQEIEELRDQIYRDYIERAKKRIEANIAVDKQQAQEDLAQYAEQVDAAEKDMNRLYAERGDQWVDTIVSRVLS